MIVSLPVPVWFFVMDSLYRNRVTFFNEKFEEVTYITFIQKDLHSHDVKITYNHLLRIIKLLNVNGLIDKKFNSNDKRLTYICLTDKGVNFCRGVDFSFLYKIRCKE